VPDSHPVPVAPPHSASTVAQSPSDDKVGRGAEPPGTGSTTGGWRPPWAILAEDHANARRIAERLAASPRVALDLDTVETNIIVCRLTGEAPDAATVVARARERGMLLFGIGARVIRAVTHLDVSRKQCEEAAEILVGIAES
jgi:hypothetical protein